MKRVLLAAYFTVVVEANEPPLWPTTLANFRAAMRAPRGDERDAIVHPTPADHGR